MNSYFVLQLTICLSAGLYAVVAGLELPNSRPERLTLLIQLIIFTATVGTLLAFGWYFLGTEHAWWGGPRSVMCDSDGTCPEFSETHSVHEGAVFVVFATTASIAGWASSRRCSVRLQQRVGSLMTKKASQRSIPESDRGGK
jgi:hypothetical protein